MQDLNTVRAIQIEGGGGELSYLDKGLAPMELSSLSVDSGGVWVAINIVKESVGGWSGWMIV